MEKQTQAVSPTPSTSRKRICFPFQSEEQYGKCAENHHQFRRYLDWQIKARPELFPKAISASYSFHDQYQSRKHKLTLRRIKLKQGGKWSSKRLSDRVAEMVKKLCRRRDEFTPAYDCPQAARASNGVDRLLNHLDRLLYAACYGRSTPGSLRLAVRAVALQWNFHPYGRRLREAETERFLRFMISMALFITRTGCITS
jgi:hypothetical protein